MGIPHLAIPLQLSGTGGFAVVEQDGLDEIAQSIAVCVATPVGSRIEVPDYGTPRAEFVGPSPADITAALAEWEPRADLDVTVVAGLGQIGELTAVTVAVRRHL